MLSYTPGTRMPASSPIAAGIDRIQRTIEARAAGLPWRRRPLARLAKRALDLAIVAPAVVVALPAMAAIGAAVSLTSPGPMLFRQQRLGLDGRMFTLWKFRTMEALPAGAEHRSSEVTRSDSRLTPIGAFLRDWRLDELPQLLQVLRGEMSLVGPRPDIPANLPAYTDEQLVRFAMPPGCTAWTFTRGAFDNDWATRQAINVEYVDAWTVWLDLEILLGTVKVLLLQEATSPSVAEAPAAGRR